MKGKILKDYGRKKMGWRENIKGKDKLGKEHKRGINML